MKILLVEDDKHLVQALVEVLTDKQHYTVDAVNDGGVGWEFIEATVYDLIILDLMLPTLDGISLCQRLRRKGCQTPVLMLTARDFSGDRVLGLDAGADDYVVKPFDLPELLARIRALLRRGKINLLPVLTWGALCLDPSNCQVTYQGELLYLTPKEYSLLELLLRQQGRLISRETIIDRLWSFDDPPSEATVKVHLKALRRKLKAVGAPADFVETVYGMGYRLKQL
ncbi:response regulator transcription factor [Oscillatoria salina]|uniref:response regulator transcription factor n=1 Tax=Oscillatoria salina TaxID=331517 RepID=UPI001CCD5900|nr:response regulator transcription factor [Oscillatoria salina]MBZ8180649.1 response regulator transcription factor [Oscillatoria salina IIICB1]